MTVDPTPPAGYTPEQAEPLALALAFIRATATDDLVAQGHLWQRIDELRARRSRPVIISGLTSWIPARAGTPRGYGCRKITSDRLRSECQYISGSLKIATLRDQQLDCSSRPGAVACHATRLEPARLNFGARQSCEKCVIRAAFPLVRGASFDG